MELTQALSTAALSGVSLSSCCAFIPACFTEHVFVQVHSDCDHTKTSMLHDIVVALCTKESVYHGASPYCVSCQVHCWAQN